MGLLIHRCPLAALYALDHQSPHSKHVDVTWLKCHRGLQFWDANFRSNPLDIEMAAEAFNACQNAYPGHPAATHEAEQSICKHSVTPHIRHAYSSHDVHSCNRR